MNPTIIKNLLEQQLNEATVIIEGDGAHFNLVIISESFTNKTTLARQKLIYSLLGEFIRTGEIHALSMQTFTPGEWEAKNG